MKIWDKVKIPLLLAIITLVMIWIRFLTMALPNWVDTMLYYPLIAVRIVLRDTWTNILLIAICAGAVMLVPCDRWNREWKLKRFLVRPAISMIAMLCVSGVLIGSNEQWEDAYWDKKVDAYGQEISAFLDGAEEVILFGHYSQHYTPEFADERIQCACGTYHNVIMIDYDTMQIAFLRHEGIRGFHVYQLRASALTEENELVQLDAKLPGSETRLITYAPDAQNDHRTCAIELRLPDGSVYSTTDTPDGNWEDGFLDLGGLTQELLFRVGQPHPW